MKYVFRQVVRYCDIDSELMLSTRSLFAYLQEAAIMHASSRGDSPAELRERANAWIMLKMGIEFVGKATFGDQLEVQTWSRGSKGVKAYRDFRVLCEGRVIGAATSVWAYIDTNQERVQRIPEELMAPYESEPELATSLDLDAWKPASLSGSAFDTVISTRSQDFDANEHMNNTVYGALVDSVISRHLGRMARYKSMKIQYDRGVTPEAESVVVSISETEPGSYTFRVHSGDIVSARGECQVIAT
jgi:acyl-ACP thioesterase